jgi:tRNA (pseudouridine54-N1)-methyltransferase
MFSLKDLPSSGKRMDIVARCIISALWLSYKLRQDTRIFVVLNGAPEPPKTVLFSPEIKRVSPDERSIALWIKKALDKHAGRRDKEWVTLSNGIKISGRSFQDIIKDLEAEGCSFYVLSEKGEDIEDVEIGENPVFVLGDHEGIPKNDEAFVLRRGKRISLGRKISYLASSCIAVVNWICDRRGI